MGGFQLGNPLALWLLVPLLSLLLAVPRLRRRLGGLRGWTAGAVRLVIGALLVLALADPQLVQGGRQLSVVFLIDRSLSISAEPLRRGVSLLRRATAEHLPKRPEDRVGVIAFGRQARVEVPVSSQADQWSGEFGTDIDRTQTDLESALSLAQAILPREGGRRVVILSDGLDTTGDANAAAQRLAQEGIGIDVIPLTWPAPVDVQLERLDLPSQVRRGASFEGRVLLQLAGQLPSGVTVDGQLQVTRRREGQEELISSQAVQLRPGLNVLRFSEQIDQGGFYTYQAAFAAQRPEQDRFSENNQAQAFLDVADQGRVIILTQSEQAPHIVALTTWLQADGFEVGLRRVPGGLGSLAELQAYDLIILDDLPRYLGGERVGIPSLSDVQLELITESVRSLGCGLLVLGGPRSFGAGDWQGSPLELALPVDFEVPDRLEQPAAALMLVIDRSGSMAGEKLELCRLAARGAIQTLKPTDSIGVLAFDNDLQELIELQPVERPDRLSEQMTRLTPGGGTDMYPALIRAFELLERHPSHNKHVIVLGDGLTPGRDFEALADEMRQANISVTSVAIGADADRQLMRMISQRSGGEFYQVDSARSVPQIVVSEARRLSRPLIFELAAGIVPQPRSDRGPLASLPGPLPNLTGYVLTEPKQSGLVQRWLVASEPDAEDFPILASWQFGFGRTAVWTSDLGRRWATAWVGQPAQQQLFRQLTRYLIRPPLDAELARLSATQQAGLVELLLELFPDGDQPAEIAEPIVQLVGPARQSQAVRLEAAGPGRYLGRFRPTESGVHIASLLVEPQNVFLRTGIDVRYSDEFLIRSGGQERLEELAATLPRGGEAGLSQPLGPEQAPQANIDFFRRTLLQLRTERPAWQLLVLTAALLWLADVANRRLAWPELLVQRPDGSAVASRGGGAPLTEAATAAPSTSPRAAAPPLVPPRGGTAHDSAGRDERTDERTDEPLSYTERLRRAKQQARR
jgi:Mg-chelatase subunit ChlD